MPRKPKKPAAGPGAARQRAAAAGPRPRRDFSAALRDVAVSNAFTMKDEARNTGQHSSLRGQATQLRAKPVSFVSAGMIEPLKEVPPSQLDDQPPDAEAEIATAITDTSYQPSSVLATEEDVTLDDTPEHPFALAEFSASVGASAAIDIAGATAVNDSPPDGNGFVIDVIGDRTLAANVSHAPPRIPEPQSPAAKSDSSSEVILFKGRANLTRRTSCAKHKPKEQTITRDTIRYEIKAVEAKMGVNPGSAEATSLSIRSRHDNKLRRFDPSEDKDEEDAILADYIANMAEDSDDGDEAPSRKPFTAQNLGADDDEFGNDSATANMSSDDGDASDGEKESESIDGDDDVMDDENSEANDPASPTIDDETLAKLLTKQEELGMGSDELLLVSDIAGGRGLPHHTTSNSRQSRRRGKGADPRTRGLFTSASAVADAFDELDLVDWERPSLQNKRSRGRRGQLPVFDVSDSEMEQALQAAALKDRESKKSRKMRREEQRAQGLLGKHANPDDPRVRFPTGMTLEDLKTEMRTFLLGSEPRLELPPMDKSARKILHELANKFKVKSQSTGSGMQRRPTLIRTKYTASYAEEHFEIAISRIERRHFPRLDLRGKGQGAQRKPRGGGGNSAVTYQDGEIVGASAPELGQENKGRTMLEKMGWSTGMGLGTVDNKGILQPVAHVVKRSKAGLG